LILAAAAMLPYLHLTPLGCLVAERYLYLPSVGFILAAAVALAAVARRMSRPLVVYAVVGACAAGLFVRTAMRNLDWRDQRTLWEATVATVPRSAYAHYQLATVDMQMAEPDHAFVEAQKAMELMPDNPMGWSIAATALMSMRQTEQALMAAQRAIALGAQDGGARYVVGVVLLGRREQAAAARMLLDALAREPNQRGTWRTIEQALQRLGPQSEFALTLRSELESPAIAHIAPRLRAML
jgi:tetratricopeptide (TPR) repeat protein